MDLIKDNGTLHARIHCSLAALFQSLGVHAPCCFVKSVRKQGSGRLLVIIQGRCVCTLHYFEHALIVIHRVADGESGELYGKKVCPGTKYSVSWVGCPELSRAKGAEDNEGLGS